MTLCKSTYNNVLHIVAVAWFCEMADSKGISVNDYLDFTIKKGLQIGSLFKHFLI
jgi:hypothetical protein